MPFDGAPRSGTTVQLPISRGYAVYFNRPGFAVVTWDPTLRAVYVDVQGWADLIELAACARGWAAGPDRAPRFAMVGRRSQHEGDQPARSAIVQEFFPRALAAGLKRIAVVIPNEHAVTTVDQLLVRLPAAKFEAAYFATEDKARSWLNTFTET